VLYIREVKPAVAISISFIAMKFVVAFLLSFNVSEVTTVGQQCVYIIILE